MDELDPSPSTADAASTTASSPDFLANLDTVRKNRGVVEPDSIGAAIKKLKRTSKAADIDPILKALLTVKSAIASHEHLAAIVAKTNKKFTISTLKTRMKELDKEQQKQHAERDRNVAPVDNRFSAWPLPHQDFGHFTIAMHNETEFLCRVTGNDEVVPLCTPIAFEARVIFEDGRNGFRVKIARPEGDVWVDLVAADAVGNGSELLKSLTDAGVQFTSQGQRFVCEWFMSWRPQAAITIVPKPGWYIVDNQPVFMSPLGEILEGGDTNMRTTQVDLKEGNPIKGKSRGGTLEGAKAVAQAVLASGCDYMAMGLLAGPASAIVNLAEIDSYTLYFGGETSKGKSTSQQLKASAWGPAKLNAGLFRTAKTTANASELLIEQGDGCGADFDETKAMLGKDVEDFIFMVAGGKGKDRQNRSGNTNRIAKQWRGTIASMSGELNVVQKIEMEGRTMQGGTTARVLVVNVGDGVTLSSQVMAAIKNCQEHYGWAGPAVVEQLISQGYAAEPHRVAEQVAEYARQLAGPKASELELRTARLYGVLWMSGVLLQDAGYITGAYDVATLMRRQWALRAADERDDGKSIKERALNKLRTSILSAEMASSDGSSAIVDRKTGALLALRSVEKNCYCIPAHVIGQLAGDTLDAKTVGSALAAADMLVLPGRHDRRTHQVMPNSARIVHYRVKSAFFRGDDSLHAEESAVKEPEIEAGSASLH